MTALASRLLTGTVRHWRAGPTGYDFRHDVYYLGLNLAELDELDRRLRLFAHAGRAPLTLRDADHFGGEPLALEAARRFGAAGHETAPARIELICHPRVLGYVFNPVSWWIARDADGEPAAVLAEVHNRSGQRHVYPITLRPDGTGYRGGAEKEFYVSPFIDMGGHYEVRLREDAGQLVIGVDEYDPQGAHFFHAGATLTPRPLTDAVLARAFARYPLVTAKTTALIHWHALRLWLRGEPFRRNRGVRGGGGGEA